MDTKTRVNCIKPSCENVINTRGLCLAHYHQARRLIQAGSTTWERLRANGKSLPSREDKSKVTQAWFMS